MLSLVVMQQNGLSVLDDGHNTVCGAEIDPQYGR
jgi:hypothetical protein